MRSRPRSWFDQQPLSYLPPVHDQVSLELDPQDAELQAAEAHIRAALAARRANQISQPGFQWDTSTPALLRRQAE
jgi:hypothetical protein